MIKILLPCQCYSGCLRTGLGIESTIVWIENKISCCGPDDTIDLRCDTRDYTADSMIIHCVDSNCSWADFNTCERNFISRSSRMMVEKIVAGEVNIIFLTCDNHQV